MDRKKRLIAGLVVMALAAIAALYFALTPAGSSSMSSGAPTSSSTSSSQAATFSVNNNQEPTSELAYFHVNPGQIFIIRSNMEESSSATVELFAGEYVEEAPENSQAAASSSDADESGEEEAPAKVLDNSATPLEVRTVSGNDEVNIKLHVGTYTVRITAEPESAGSVTVDVI